MTLAEKFTRLKTSVGGNREKMHFEDTFGMPKEEQAHITRPGRANARILAELEFALHLSEAENGKYDAALEEALDYLLEKQQTEGVLTDQACEEAEEILEPIAEEAKSYELILAAHAHIDMNWMWSFNETVSIVLATFRSILNIMDQYPEFCFSQSQASVYKIVEEYDPELMERIKARIAEGRWEVTASAWVETDKNMPSGESLLRHIQYTREYLSKVWGVKDFDLDFSPDTFGHSANVPEIDQFGGVKYFYHCRGNARRDVLYRYQAPSGKEVLTYREPNWYNGAITPQIGAGFMEIVKKSSGLKTGLVVYGVGDHGGGPTRRDVERALEMQTWKIYPKIRFGTFRDYFHEAEKIREKLPVVAAVSFGFSFWMNQKMVSGRVSYDTAVKLKEKEASMLKRVLYLPEYAKDIRSFGMKQTVLERYRKNTEEKAVLIRKQGGKIGRLTALETIGGSCLLIDFFASLYLAVKTLVWNTMTASGFVAVLNACNQIQFSLESLSAQIAVFAENGTLIERFRTVENMEPEIEKKEPGQSAAPFETLQVQDICFQYENNKFGLKNVRFEIKKGEKVAFVGENGSGKTTLVKLLLRLYDCSSGEILYNGMPVEKMNTRTYRSAYSTLFQDFNLYAASVAENVSMNQNPDLEKVRDALICARIPKAADQLDGIISKEFCADGIDFSGGERQRIALARIFYENHDILIMDEPTAAMDIRFEKEFYDLVFSYLKDKTILMISHRLASITACDRIFYMENGSITEQGTHQELMEKQGKYAKLFLAQLN